jgi:hypothetical protein
MQSRVSAEAEKFLQGGGGWLDKQMTSDLHMHQLRSQQQWAASRVSGWLAFPGPSSGSSTAGGSVPGWFAFPVP